MITWLTRDVEVVATMVISYLPLASCSMLFNMHVIPIFRVTVCSGPLYNA